ncbi:peroxisomal membrane anchor protein (Pex14p) conserved region domain-containing protein [Sarocladium implicatum]|nr:peroxisomal membrane anchor protein (Pex14p) conserved region domain-containing protein [Sarocladium implicatum]
MSDTDEKPAIPSWQRNTSSDSSSAADAASETASTATVDDQLEIARRFLQDDAVKNEPQEKKAEFLREKGIAEDDVQKLLAELSGSQSPSEVESSPETTETSTSPSTHSSSSSETSRTADTTLSSPSDRPPIVTYPEFLTQPTRPPPLVTTTSILTTLSTFAGLATLVHGTSRYLLEPMHESLTEARLDFHSSTSDRLNALVSRLEETVSELPPQPSTHKKSSFSDAEDQDSEADDPTEMFHRDVGTQTSTLIDFPPSSTKKTTTPPASEVQATRLQDLVSSLKPLNDSFRTQSTDFHDIGTLIDVFRDDLQGMVQGGKPPYSFYGRSGAVSAVNGYSYGMNSYKEPDDEIKKAKDGIRRVKGVLLSTRNFPASTA